MRIYISILLLFAVLPAYCQLSFIGHHYNIPNHGWVNHAATGDFNGDGRQDVITAGSYPWDSTTAFFYIFNSNAADSLDTTAVKIPFQRSSILTVTGMAVADMNHDRLDDIIISTSDSLYVYYQNPAHTFTISSSSRYTEQQIAVIRIADIDQDGNNDIIIGTTTTGALSILYGTAVTDSFVQIDYPASTSVVKDVKIGYLGRDTVLSIITMPEYVTSQQITATKIKPNRQINTVSDFQIPHIFLPALNDIAIGDRFGDGNNEMVVIEILDTLACWTHPDTGLSSDTYIHLIVNTNEQSVIIEDLNCDGKDEVILAGVGNKISIMDYMNSFQSFTAFIPNNLDYDDMVVANVLGDIKPDIIVANTYGGITVLENISLSNDSSVVNSYTLAVDTNQVQTGINTVVLTEHIYTHADTLVLRKDSVKIYSGYIDTNTTVINSGQSVSRCTGYTTTFTDTIHRVSAHLLYQDTVYFSTSYDTLIVTSVQSTGGNNANIYPDPFTSGINIRGVEENTLVELYTLTGDLIISERCTGNCFIPRYNLSQGLYILKITSNNNIFCRKVTAF